MLTCCANKNRRFSSAAEQLIFSHHTGRDKSAKSTSQASLPTNGIPLLALHINPSVTTGTEKILQRLCCDHHTHTYGIGHLGACRNSVERTHLGCAQEKKNGSTKVPAFTLLMTSSAAIHTRTRVQRTQSSYDELRELAARFH